MKEVFGYFTFTEKQKEIINECKHKNHGEYQKWFYNNLFFPLLIILLTAVIVYANESYDISSLMRALFNGGLSLLGINILFSMSSYVIRQKRAKDSELNENVVNLSDKLNNYQIPLVIFGSIFYLIVDSSHKCNTSIIVDGFCKNFIGRFIAVPFSGPVV